LLAAASYFFMASSWQTVVGPEGSFTVEMPGKPAYVRKDMKTDSGEPIVMHRYTVEAGGASYMVQSTSFADSADLSDPKPILQSLIEHAAELLSGGKWSSVNWVKHYGLIAVNAYGTANGDDVQNFEMIHGRQLLLLSYKGPNSHSSDPIRFFASLKLRN
jgi:hypothetical protein